MRFGRPPKLTTHQRREALDRLAAGGTQADVARTFGVDPTTYGQACGTSLLGYFPEPVGSSLVSQSQNAFVQRNKNVRFTADNGHRFYEYTLASYLFLLKHRPNHSLAIPANRPRDLDGVHYSAVGNRISNLQELS